MIHWLQLSLILVSKHRLAETGYLMRQSHSISHIAQGSHKALLKHQQEHFFVGVPVQKNYQRDVRHGRRNFFGLCMNCGKG